MVLGWLLFEYGRSVAGFSAIEAFEKQSVLTKRIGELEAENDRLRVQVAAFEQSGEIDRRAYEEVNRNLADRQDEMLELRQEVAFYRGIITSEEAAAGLRIQSFKLKQEDTSHYQYRLVLTHLATTTAQVQGEAEISVSGIMNGSPVDLSQRDLGGRDRHEVHFKLRHFQELRGALTLPEGFVPMRVILKVTPKNASSTVERTFDWNEVTS